MLTPEYLAGCADQVEALYSQLDEDITKDICRRIIKTGEVTSTAEWQIKQLQENGKLYDDIVAEVSKATGKNESVVRQMFKDAGIKAVQNDTAVFASAGISLPNGLSGAMKNVLEANLQRTNGTMLNLAMTTASASQTEFVSLMNEAIMKVESGAFSYQEAIRYAVNQAAKTGAKVEYDSGTQLSLEAAARMNILTAVNQTAGKITEMNAARMGAEYYETSAHSGARLEHQDWQGRVFKIEGAEPDYPNFYDETGYGDVTGLCGANCRHSFFPFFPGLSERAYSEETLEAYNEKKYEWNGESYTEYEASQIMRRYERAVRDSKRIMAGYNEAIDVAEDEELKAELQTGLQQAKQTYDARRYRLLDFCKETGFDRDYLRTKTALDGYEALNGKMVSLSFDEASSVVKYISSDFYPIQYKVRYGERLTEAEQTLMDNLASALTKFPKYEGDVSRSVYFYSEEELADFLLKHQTGEKVTYETFTSCTAAKEAYNPDAQVEMFWHSSNGRNFTQVNKAEVEVLYERNASFVVNAVEKVDDSKYYIFMEEMQ